MIKLLTKLAAWLNDRRTITLVLVAVNPVAITWILSSGVLWSNWVLLYDILVIGALGYYLVNPPESDSYPIVDIDIRVQESKRD